LKIVIGNPEYVEVWGITDTILNFSLYIYIYIVVSLFDLLKYSCHYFVIMIWWRKRPRRNERRSFEVPLKFLTTLPKHDNRNSYMLLLPCDNSQSGRQSILLTDLQIIVKLRTSCFSICTCVNRMMFFSSFTVVLFVKLWTLESKWC
jgi:hypothetical protein